MSPIERVLSNIDAQHVGPNQWEACCPAHDDDRASLSIGKGKHGRVLLNCHAGCQAKDIVQAVGLRMSDLFPPINTNAASKSTPPKHKPSGKTNGGPSKPPKRPTKPPIPVSLDKAIQNTANRLNATEAGRWLYHDEHGNEVACAVRFETPTGKEYRPFRKDGPVWEEGGMGDERRPLYRLSELAEPGRVYVCEGEKAADAACDLGLTATTSMQGAKSSAKTDWKPLAGKEVVILPDNDSSGGKYADAVADILAGLSPTPTVKVLELPDLPEHGDIVEFIESDADQSNDAIRAELEALADNAIPIDMTKHHAGPVVISLADVEPEELAWLWPGRIPVGKLTMVAGDPGLGKSFITLDMAARVSRGIPWPDSPSTPIEPAGVLIMSVEDDIADTVVPRLKEADANFSRINAFNSVRELKPNAAGERLFNLESDIPYLEQAIQQTPNCQLIVIDPVSAFMGKADSHNNTEVRGLLAPLTALAAKYRVAVVCVSHLNKNAGGSPIYRTIGSIAQVAAARMAHGVVKDKGDNARRLCLPIKSNLAPDGHGLAYRIVDSNTPGVARVEWEPVPVDTPVEEAFAPETKQPGPEPREREEAERWLRQALADGPRPAKELENEAENREDIGERTLRRARKAIGVDAYRPENPGPWYWRLPEAGDHTDPGDT